MYPPHIYYQTPYVRIRVALPLNMTREGQPLAPPLPQESEIRELMIGFSEKIQALYDASAAAHALTA